MNPDDLLFSKVKILKELLSGIDSKYGNTFNASAKVIANALAFVASLINNCPEFTRLLAVTLLI
jgi:hypothetical protein